MKCKSKVDPKLASAIQIVEDHLRAQKESVISLIEAEMIKALVSGIKLENIKIIETTTWTSQSRKADYSVVVKDKTK